MNLLVPGHPQALHRAHARRGRASSARRGPTRPLRIGLALRRWGPTPAAGYTASAIRDPDEHGDHRRARHADLRARSTGAPTRWPTRSPTPASGRATASRSCAATTAASSTPRSPARSSAPTRCTSTPPSPARRSPTSSSARSRSRSSTTRSSRSSSHDAGERRKRFIAWHDGDDEAQGPAARGPDRRRRPRRRRPARREGPRRDPHQRHDRHAEGRAAQAARVAGPGRRAVLEDPAARRASRR